MLNQNSLLNLYKLYFRQRPPKTVEEFLKNQNWDYWPRDFIFPNKDQWLNDLQQLKHDCTVAEIYSHLWSTVPRVYDASMNMETRLAECLAFMKKHASKLFEEENLVTRTFLGCKSPIKKHKKKEKIMLSPEMKTEKNIEGFNFAGFKASELTSLPRHLDAERIYLFILKAQKLDVKVFKIWKSHFLLPSSIALLIDSFWWWFLYKFKVYPDYLSQAIYVTFQKAFPESCELFDEAFTKELVNTVFLWLSGLKPQKHVFAHWKWNDLCTSTTQDLKKETSKPLLEKCTRTQELISSCK
ncbi:protein FAM227B [Sorex fumeus]|uniref:protein FAM227B n=1 Tax=Sorex fumeus TaxID=62283 RepID=UPI0024AE6817|nr:protein FAM227B [Sorex fumeus]